MAYQPAGFWIRFLAALIDGIILMILMLPFSIAISAIFKMFPTDMVIAAFSMFVSLVVNMGIGFAYYCYFYSKRGATPGKHLLDLKVLNVSDDAYLGPYQTFLRETVGKPLSGLILLIGYLMAAIRTDRRALHDLIADSRVVRVVRVDGEGSI